MRNIFSIIIITFLISGCDDLSKVDRAKVREEIKRREIKKVSEAEILNEGMRIGREIASEAYRLMNKRSLQLADTAHLSKNNADIVDYIHDLDSLEKAYEAEIQFLSLVASEKQVPDNSLEKEILEAYRYNLENNIPLSENLQKTKADYIIYNQPVIIRHPCLQCHGSAGDSDSGINSVQLKEGDALRIWHIKLSQKKIVQDL